MSWAVVFPFGPCSAAFPLCVEWLIPHTQAPGPSSKEKVKGVSVQARDFYGGRVKYIT